MLKSTLLQSCSQAARNCQLISIIPRGMIIREEKSACFKGFFLQFLLMTQQYTPPDSKGALINLKKMSSHHIAGLSPTKALFSKPNDDDNEIF